MAVEYSNNIATFISGHNTHVFDNIGKNMDKLVRNATKDRTMKMVYALKFRENLGHGWGKFPLGITGDPHAHTSWKWSKTKDGYQISNQHRNSTDGYPYVRNLVAGTGWSARVMASNIGGPLSRLTKNNSRVFSKQMPFGIRPWILNQRQLLIEEIKLLTGDKIIRGGKTK